MLIDLGDITLAISAFVGDPPPVLVWRLGPVGDTVPADRAAGPRPTNTIQPGKVDWIMDLKADQKVPFSIGPHDEIGNLTTFDGTIAFAVDDPSIVALTDNGDGTGEAAATGALGPAVITATATRNSDGKVFTGAGLVNVVPGDAETFSVDFGTPEEVTPDV